MKRIILRLAPAFALAFALLAPARAEAAPGLVLITHGENVKHVGKVAEPLREEVREATGTPRAPDVGFLYNGFGVFWLDVWTWNGRHCLYSGNQCWELEPGQAAEMLGISPGQLSAPFLYKFPPGLMVLLGIVALWAARSWRQRAQARELGEKIQELAADSRYQGALKILQEHYAEQSENATDDENPEAEPPPAEPDDTGYRKAIQHLVNQGVDREEAEHDLGLLLAVMTASSTTSSE